MSEKISAKLIIINYTTIWLLTQTYQQIKRSRYLTLETNVIKFLKLFLILSIYCAGIEDATNQRWQTACNLISEIDEINSRPNMTCACIKTVIKFPSFLSHLRYAPRKRIIFQNITYLDLRGSRPLFVVGGFFVNKFPLMLCLPVEYEF